MFGKTKQKNKELIDQVNSLTAKLQEQQEAFQILKERNRDLEAKLSAYSAKEKAISESLILATEHTEELKRQAEQIKNMSEDSSLLLSEQCRALLEELILKYPESSDLLRFESFTKQLNGILEQPVQEEVALTEEDGFPLSEVLSPDKDLDLEKICKDLGLMGGKK